MPVSFSKGSVNIDGQPTFIFSGELISYRVPGHLWRDRLEKLKAAGLNTVGIYFAWDFHSDRKGAADFTSPDRDISSLLDHAAELGLHVIARPGPYVCNEWDLGGYPGWLLQEDAGDWRSGDPKHLAFCREWYRQVNAVLKAKQFGADGSIILYQIENEHRWNDRAFLAGLSDAAREDGIIIPLIGNHDGGGLCALDKLAEGTDIYTSVFEFYRWRGWLETLKRRIGPDIPLMVLEFRCGEHPLWGQPPVSSTWPPPHWTFSQTRMFMAVGANVVNHFVGAGGITPVGFNSDHITTSYVDNPPVSPWGELTERFYEMRLLGMFQESFNRPLAEAAPLTGAWGTDDVQVECLVRKCEKATFLFLSNHSNGNRDFHIILPDGRSVPNSSKMRIAPYRTKLLVADVELADGLRIVFSPFQILSSWTDGTETQLVFYGESGEEGVIEFAVGTERQTVALTCADTVGVATITIAGRRVTVYAASAEIAARTWLPRRGDGRVVPLFGKIPLMRPQPASGAPARLEVSATETELNLTVPAKFADSLLLDGASPKQQTARPNGLTDLLFKLPPMEKPIAELGSLQFVALDDDWTTAMPTSENGWHPAKPWGEGAEIMVVPGDYEWRTDFTAADPLPKTIELLGVANAEVTVFLNGVLLGCYPARRLASTNSMPSFNAVFDIRKIVRTGVNQLAAHVHFHGRHNSGQPIYAGFSHPIVLRNGTRKEKVQQLWKVSPVSYRKWTVSELDAAPVMDSSKWEEIDLGIPDDHCGPAGTAQHHEVRWYRRTLQIPKAFRGKPLFLECPPVEEAWAYAEGKSIGRTLSATSTTFDLTPFAEHGTVEITLAVRHNWHFWIDRFGLHGAPRLVSPGQPIESTWQLRGRPLAASEPWRNMNLKWQDDSADIGTSRRVFMRCPVKVSVPPDCAAPLFVELDDWSSRVVLYWNGQPIGLYSEVGPQKRFYIPEGMIRQENTVHVLVDGYRGCATVGTIAAGFYFINRCVILTV